jgi:hypothetical protein
VRLLRVMRDSSLLPRTATFAFVPPALGLLDKLQLLKWREVFHIARRSWDSRVALVRYDARPRIRLRHTRIYRRIRSEVTDVAKDRGLGVALSRWHADKIVGRSE